MVQRSKRKKQQKSQFVSDTVSIKQQCLQKFGKYKKCLIWHILIQKTLTSVLVKMCKYIKLFCKWTVTYIYAWLLFMCKWFFYSFFLSPCQVTLSSLFFSQQRKKKVGGAIWIVILHRDTYNITWTQRNIYIHTHTPNHMRFARTVRLLYIKVMFKEGNSLIYK